ncbi:M48 family peptidase [Butyrivibrio sp. CB08]|uniref:M48 family metallopeptidase n=1 Tax=Butyrivibrio sp. CB08 TaxID=2364879 RepID=UPI000EAA3E25|nr:SprT family zinc-dependent metalloprotease [Butyrivibrio sp. CB08]RKM61397.1 M48 family peptidase [Butyrivibrio sp. CB08]
MKQEIKLIRSRRKTISIEVTADAQVIVRAPMRVSLREINRFVGEKADWIDKSLRKMKERQEEISQEGKEPLSPQEVKLLVTRAKRIIPQRVRYYAGIMGVTYGRITIRMQKSRWGSCSGKGNLNFNCLLMRTPDEIIDYVVVHELCHLKEMNHSKRFWAEVEKIIPDYKERRKWLKDHESELMYR